MLPENKKWGFGRPLASISYFFFVPPFFFFPLAPLATIVTSTQQLFAISI